MQPIKYISPVLLFFCVGCFASIANAGSFEDAQAAYDQHDYKTALTLWQPLAAQGNIQAQYNLGLMYDYGFGVKKDCRQAAEWFRRAAIQGNAAAERHYEADNFSLNLGLPKVAQAKATDIKAAEKTTVAKAEIAKANVTHAAAAKTDIANKAQHMAEIKPAAGEVALQPVQLVPVTPPSPPSVSPSAVKPAQASSDMQDLAARAEHGDAAAQNKLGNIYNLGEGMPQNYTEAARLYRLAADQGNAQAQENLGTLYVLGHGVPQDYQKAAQWYNQAAMQGNAAAQTALASLYGAGLGVPQDYGQAEKLYSQAAAQGNKTAQNELDIIHENKLTAPPKPIPPVPKMMTLATQQGFDIGGDVSAYKYHETVNGDIFVHHADNKLGLEGGYTYVVDPYNAFIRGEVKYSHGGVDYSSASGVAKGQPEHILEWRALEGKDFIVNDFSLSPYFGFGYRYLYNDARGTTSLGFPGYRRISRYRYIPIGSTGRYALGEQERLAANIEYDLFLGGTMDSDLSDTNQGLGDILNHQHSGTGVRGSLLLETTAAGGLAVGPWFSFWHITPSDAVPIPGNPGFAGIEPNNETTELGLKVVKYFW